MNAFVYDLMFVARSSKTYQVQRELQHAYGRTWKREWDAKIVDRTDKMPLDMEDWFEVKSFDVMLKRLERWRTSMIHPTS